ncbi:MAG: ABC transporter substrate-binding protein [Thermoplasmataceae archaeon]
MNIGSKRNKAIISILLVVIVIASAVSYEGYTALNNLSKGNINNTSASRGEINVTDILGQQFTFNSTLTRIVSFDPSATALLYALGAYKDVVATGSYDNYPPNGSAPVICNDFQVSYSSLVALKPQAVLGYGATVPSYGLKINNTLNIPFILDNPNSVSQIENETLMLGKLTGTLSNATLITYWMNQSLSDIKKIASSLPNESAFYFECESGGSIYTAGNNTFINEEMQYVHLINIFNQSGFGTISPEVIANSNPQAILIDCYASVSNMSQAPFNETTAVKNSNYIQFFNDTYFVSPNFQFIYGIEWLLQWRAHGNSLMLSELNLLPSFPIKLKYSPDFNYEPPT